MYINGEWVAAQSGKVFDIFNPANGETIGQAPDGGAGGCDPGYPVGWHGFQDLVRHHGLPAVRIFYEAYRITPDREEDRARLMTREQGKPLKAARYEVQYGADFLLWFAEEAKRVYGETIMGTHKFSERP